MFRILRSKYLILTITTYLLLMSNINISANELSNKSLEQEVGIEQQVIDSNNDNFVSNGEILTYTVTITNNTYYTLENISIRDNLLEQTPTYMESSGGVKTNVPNDQVSGDLTEGNCIISSLLPDESVTFSFELKVSGKIPNYVSAIDNIVTYEVEDDHPQGVVPRSGYSQQAFRSSQQPSPSSVVVNTNTMHVNPVTQIEQSVAESVDDQQLTAGELLDVEVNVKNPSYVADAYNVPIRDSLLEDMPDFLTLKDDYQIEQNSALTSGSLEDGTFQLDRLDSTDQVTIKFQMEVADKIPASVTALPYTVTNNGDEPSDVDPDSCANKENCSSWIIPIGSQETTDGGGTTDTGGGETTDGDGGNTEEIVTDNGDESQPPVNDEDEKEQADYIPMDQVEKDDSPQLVTEEVATTFLNNEIATVTTAIPTETVKKQAEKVEDVINNEQLPVIDAQLVRFPKRTRFRILIIISTLILILVDAIVLKWRLSISE